MISKKPLVMILPIHPLPDPNKPIANWIERLAKANNLQFRKLRDREFDQAHGIISDAVDWLLSKNIRQWTVPLPRHIYRTWQGKAHNYALTSDGELAVILSLLQETSPHWLDKTGSQPCWLICKHHLPV